MACETSQPALVEKKARNAVQEVGRDLIKYRRRKDVEYLGEHPD